MPLVPLMPLVEQNQARNTLQNPNGTNDSANDTNNMPLVNYDQNHAQKQTSNDTNDTNDTLHNINGKIKMLRMRSCMRTLLNEDSLSMYRAWRL